MSNNYPPAKSFECDASSLDEEDVAIVITSDVTVTFEDLEDQPIHDQLPSVEEAKATLSHLPSNHGKKRRLCYIGAGIAVLITLITIIAVAVSNNKSNKNTSIELTGRYQEVVKFLYGNGISNLPSFGERESPQHLAALFVADADLFNAEMSDANLHRFVERYVLAVIYFETKGPEWTNNYKFLSAHDHCDWREEVTRPAGTFVKGVECNSDGRVIGLDLSHNNLRGYHIPEEIKWFEQLEKLHLYKNKLGGALPYKMRELKNLKSLGLMDAGLQGSIPDWFGELTQLTTLALSQNNLHGTIPDAITNLSNLRILGLDSTGLTGSINHVKGLKKLEALYLDDNKLTGNLEGDSLWPSLRELDVSDNLLDGTIPSTLFHSTDLTVVDIHQNMFFGNFPEQITSNEKLEFVSMSHNSLAGTVSDRIGFLKNLKLFDISMNILTGTLPDTIQELTNLRYLTTSGNRFSNQSMIDLSMLTELRDVSMKGNNLIGALPESLAELSNLQMLDLDGNSLTGTIPTWFGLMHSLEHLLLNRNELTGTLPEQLGNLKGLKVFLVDGNNFSGSAKAICDAPISLVQFVADCYPGHDGSKPEVECRCCTLCCNDDDPECNNVAWTSNYDPKYQYGYIRQEYGYSLDQAPPEWSKDIKEKAQGQAQDETQTPDN